MFFSPQLSFPLSHSLFLALFSFQVFLNLKVREILKSSLSHTISTNYSFSRIFLSPVSLWNKMRFIRYWFCCSSISTSEIKRYSIRSSLYVQLDRLLWVSLWQRELILFRVWSNSSEHRRIIIAFLLLAIILLYILYALNSYLGNSM